MRFVAQEMREYMAKLGVRTVDELIGRTDLLYRERILQIREQMRLICTASLIIRTVMHQ